MADLPARRREADVLVVGAGPAGLAAAVAAAESGARVLLVDDNPDAGGQIWRAARGRLPPRAAALLARAERAGVAFVPGLTVFGAGAPGVLHAADAAGAPTVLRAARLVLCTGSTELFLPFPGWTLPGVCGVGGLQALVKGGLDVGGRRVAVAGSGPLLLAVAATLRAHGATVLGIHEQAPRRRVLGFGLGLARHPARLARALRLTAQLRGVPWRCAEWPVACFGEGRLQRVLLRAADGRARSLDVDLLACSFGLMPRARLAALCGCATRSGRVVVDDRLQTSVPGVFCAGESTGIGGVDLALAEGRIAGLAAAGAGAPARAARRRVRRERRFAAALDHAFALRDELRTLPDDATVVCRCEDVPFGALRACSDARQAKLETRCGMGACQGRICGPALTFLRRFPSDRVRPPLLPVPMATLAAVAAAPTSTPHPSSQETSR